MSDVAPLSRLTPEPLPDNIGSVQPGGGWIYHLELLWGKWRRCYLKTFRRGYVRRMAEKRTGSADGAPHEILDPRDLKYCRNLCTANWAPEDDPFHWREKIPFARWGLCELIVMSAVLIAVGAAIVYWLPAYWYLAVIPGLLLAEVVYFFRDPPRKVPTEPGLVVSPADGTVVDITRLEHDPFVAGPAIRIGIFLSIFNVHINRFPVAARCIRQEYRPGKYLNALREASVRENEALTLYLEEDAPPYRRYTVRQIAGAIARRIVCEVRPGERLERGQKYGMIKLGSRTELILPDDGQVEITVAMGQAVKAGSTIMARYLADTHSSTKDDQRP